MAHGRRISQLLSMLAVAGAITVGLTSTPAFADGHEGPNQGAVSVSGELVITNEYWFRGINQEDQGMIYQPGVTVSFDLTQAGLEGVSAYFGTWNSIHDGPSSSGSTGAAATGSGGQWYESDWYFGVNFGLFDNVGVDVSYVVLYGPAGGTIFAEEIDVAVNYDDAGMWAEEGFLANGLQPYALVAFETDGASDGGSVGAGVVGTSEGIYLEVGIEPTWTWTVTEDFAIDMALPVSVGISLDDYYETVDPTTGGVEDEDFGFLSVGITGSVPLDFIPADYGAWTLSAGFTYLGLNEATINNIAAPGGVNSDRFIATLGVGFEY